MQKILFLGGFVLIGFWSNAQSSIKRDTTVHMYTISSMTHQAMPVDKTNSIPVPINSNMGMQTMPLTDSGKIRKDTSAVRPKKN